MSRAWEEGDFLVLESSDGNREPGFIMLYHARGECQLVLGIVWLLSGKYMELRNAVMKTACGQEMKRIESAKLIPAGQDFDCVRLFMRSHKRAEKRSKSSSSASDLDYYQEIMAECFTSRAISTRPFRGSLELSKKFSTLHAVIKAVEMNAFVMHRRKNDEVRELDLMKFLKDTSKGRCEGVWMNPSVSQACLKFFGIPKAYFQTGRKLVSHYNQMILQVDGTDSARTLGMHKDRDETDKEVCTVLGCVAGDGGKDVILWTGETGEVMPRWWRNEGMSRDSFLLAKLQCQQNEFIKDNVTVLTLEPGDFIYMPRVFTLVNTDLRVSTETPSKPGMKKVSIIVTLFTVWALTTSNSLKMRSLFAAGAFYLIESTYVYMHGKEFHSTFAQLWNNIWSHPLISDWFFLVIASAWPSWARILAYPIVIWALELVQSTVITAIYKRNIAWDYSDNKWSFFNGSIDLSMFTEWWCLGAAMECIYYPYIFSQI